MSQRDQFELIYNQHAPAVKAYVMRRARDAVADDVVSDVFTVCWRRLPDVPEDSLPWLIGVASRVLQTQRRTDARRDRLRERLTDAGTPAKREEPALGPAATLGGALAQMRNSDRELLLLIAWDGLSPTEAAAVLGIAPVTVRVRLHRARNRLRLALLETSSEGTPERPELSMEGSP
jgi:RNA polymerase sigma-70 factor, ECF subfamily